MALYFVVRTDVTAGSGQQRVFGVYDTEAEAAAQAEHVAKKMYGDFEIVPAGLPTMRVVREGGIQAVRAVQIVPTE